MMKSKYVWCSICVPTMMKTEIMCILFPMKRRRINQPIIFMWCGIYIFNNHNKKQEFLLE